MKNRGAKKWRDKERGKKKNKRGQGKLLPAAADRGAGAAHMYSSVEKVEWTKAEEAPLSSHGHHSGCLLDLRGIVGNKGADGAC